MQTAIEPPASLPDAWLTSFWGYDPATWGCLGFTYESERQRYLDNSTDGTLLAVYVTGNKVRPGLSAMHGKVVGIMEMSRTLGFAEDFIAPEQRALMHGQLSAGKWRYSVEVRRAWRIVPEEWTAVAEVAPLSYRPDLGQHISRRGVRLHPRETARLLRFTVEEVSVYGSGSVAPSATGPLAGALRYSRPGPVSQSPYVIQEAEGPKRLYILRLAGDTAAMLGRAPGDGQAIVKVGFSGSPPDRRDCFQAALPGDGYRWELLRSDAAPWSDSATAIAGENAMKTALATGSLGGKFFLADTRAVDRAWTAGQRAARRHR